MEIRRQICQILHVLQERHARKHLTTITFEQNYMQSSLRSEATTEKSGLEEAKSSAEEELASTKKTLADDEKCLQRRSELNNEMTSVNSE